VGLAPLLQLEQFDLQQPLLFLVLLALHALVVRVVLPPSVDRHAARIEKDGIVIVVVMNAEVAQIQSHRQTVSARANAKVNRL